MNSKLILSIFHILFIALGALTYVDSFQCPEKFGHYPDGTDCSKYFVCNHGRSLMQMCEDGLLYNTVLKTCDWPRNVMCDKGGKRVNTRRNPDLKKTSYKRHKSEFEESNQLSPHTNSEELNTYDSPPNDHNYDNYGSDEFRPNNNYREPAPNGRPPVKPAPPKWHQDFTPKHFTSNTQSRGPVTNNRQPKASPIVAPPTVDDSDDSPPEEQPKSDYEYDTPDYYEYEADAPVRIVRKPVKEAEPPTATLAEHKQKSSSVKRIGWLPEDPDSDRMNEYHWSPKDAVGYSKDKPRIPNDAYVIMDDFRNVEKKLAEDDSPNVGPEEDAEYSDYYEDDDDIPVEDEEDYHRNEPAHDEEPPPSHEEHEDGGQADHAPPPADNNDSPNEVRYDDDEEVRQQPRIPPPSAIARPQTRQRVPIPPPPKKNYITSDRRPQPTQNHQGGGGGGAGEPFARIKHPQDEISGLRSVANTFESVPKPITSAAKSATSADHLSKPNLKTNIHYINQNSPYLRPALDEPHIKTSDSPQQSHNYKKGRLIKSVPRNDVNPKRRVVIRKVIKQNRQPQTLSEDSSEPVTPSIYQLLDDYRKDLPDALLSHKKTAQDFRNSIVDNYMNNEKPNYILNDKDFEVKTYTGPVVNGEGEDNLSDNIRDFDIDFPPENNEQNREQNRAQNREQDREQNRELISAQNREQDREQNKELISAQNREQDREQNRELNREQKREQNKEEFHKKMSSYRNSVEFKNQNNYNNETTDKPFNDRTGNHIMNTDAIVKQQRAQDSVSSLTTVSPPAAKVTKRPINYSTPPFNEYKAPKRVPQPTPPTRFGFKQSAVIPNTSTTPAPIPKPSPKTKIRIKTPKPTLRTTLPVPRPTRKVHDVPVPRPVRKPVQETPAPRPTTKPVPKKKTDWSQSVPYEPKPSNTDLTVTKAHKCDPMYCRLPDCRCGGTDIPDALHPKQTPQIVLLTFDDSVNDLNWDTYDELFNSGRNNPNGCPILATFYVSHEWTDYAQVQTLYSKGHEIASHSITHSFGEKFSKDLWLKEIAGQRELLSRYGGVKESDVRGMRAPFLQTGGNTMFDMLYEANFTYDSSLPVYEINPPYYPYTLDYAINHECMIPPCPTKSFPGLWEVGMVMWEDLRNGRCSMADACFNPKDEQGVYDMVKKNFERHYTTNRSPFGMYFHSRWFLTDHNRKGFLKWLDEVNGLNDVYFVTNWQMIQWMQNPTPINKIQGFKPWKCDYTDRPHECDQPNMCKAKFRSETRVFKTCQPCPKVYPWRGNNGLKYEN